MYLYSLENLKKYLFRELELYMAKTDGDFSEEEKRIILAINHLAVALQIICVKSNGK